MPLAKDLTGIGFPAIQSAALGDNPAVAVTAAGSTAAGATLLLLAQNNVLLTATGADGIRLPLTGTPLQRFQIISNVSASTGLVYPPTGSNFTGGSTDAGISLLSRKSIIVWRYSALGWGYNMSA